MDQTAFGLLILIGMLLGLSAAFSGGEVAFFSLDRFQLRRFERSESRRERVIAALCARPERLLGGILFGNTLVNVASSSAAVAFAHRVEGPENEERVVAAAVAGVTLLILFAGEILPKGMAVRGPAGAARAAVLILEPILLLIHPVARALEKVADLLLRALGVRRDTPRSGYSRPELQLLFESSRGERGISAAEGELAANLFEFFDTRAVEIMTPRVDIEGLPVDAPRDTLRDRIIESRHARLPVYRGSLDRVLGFVNTKEFLLHEDRTLETLLKPVHFVPERARVQGILAEMQSRQLPMVIVVNEYGGTSGLLTPEDVVEEIVGEIFDEQERDQEPELHPLGDNVWRVDGLVGLEELGEALGARLPEGPTQTVAGRVAHVLGRPPRAGEVVADGPVTWLVVQVRRHRARRVEVRLTAGADAGRAP